MPAKSHKSCGKKTTDKKGSVYLITSKKGAHILGKTTGPLNHRLNQYRHAIKTGQGEGQKIIKYYRKPGNDFGKAKVKVLFQSSNPKKLEKEKAKYMPKYKKNGLNTKK
uniref:GIY-YIG domain-containing protein n=1 Tax=Amphimedon queenslandica TaxID=400682 RepID=A0A1X7VT03_AMPQE